MWGRASNLLAGLPRGAVGVALVGQGGQGVGGLVAACRGDGGDVVHRPGLPQVDGIVVVEGAPTVVHDQQPRWGVDLTPAGPVPDEEGEGWIHQEGDDLRPRRQAIRLDDVL